jgi:hypothetical protein
MERDQLSGGEARERTERCTAPHPMLGLGVTMGLMAIGYLVYWLVR